MKKAYSMPTTHLCQVETSKKLDKKPFILDATTGKIIKNPEWTNEDSLRLKELAPVTQEDFKKKQELVALSTVYMNKEQVLKNKIKEAYLLNNKKFWNPTDQELTKIKKNNYAKSLDVTFSSKITPEEFFTKMQETKEVKSGESTKWLLLKYFHHCVFELGLKSLHQTQTYLAKRLNVTREWICKVISKLQEEGLITHTYRHLCSCFYSINNLCVDMFYRDQLEELFGAFYYRFNTYQQRKFTQELNLKYINIIKLDSLSIIKENLDQKGDIRSKFSSILQKLTKNLTNKAHTGFRNTPVLCP